MRDVNWRKKEWKITETELGDMIMYNIPLLNEHYAADTYQMDISRLIKSGEYDIFIDVGSYTGYFSRIASSYCKRVIAFEASPFIYGLLLYNTQFLNNVECRYKWISCNGDIPKSSIDPFDMVRPNGAKEYNIQCVTLDDQLKDIMNEKIFIKMDIEGSELNALRGAIEVLKHPNIHWQVDIHLIEGITREIIKEFFKDREIIDIGVHIIVKGLKK